MMLVDETQVPVAALPVAEFRDHLRLGTGFADGGLQDNVLETCLRAALAAIEARTGKVLIRRSFRWSVAAWRDLSCQALPLAPVALISALKVLDRFGAANVIDVEAYWLRQDDVRPTLVSAGIALPTIPVGGTAEISFEAGFGASWGDMPADLAQAVMLLAAHFYETRDASATRARGMPSLVLTLIERYRVVRTYDGGLA